jgi:hypothetical protein
MITSWSNRCKRSSVVLCRGVVWHRSFRREDVMGRFFIDFNFFFFNLIFFKIKSYKICNKSKTTIYFMEIFYLNLNILEKKFIYPFCEKNI